MTPQDASAATPGTPPAPNASLWEDFVDIFYTPSDVFRRRATGSYMIPLVIVTLLVCALTFTNRSVLQPVYDAEIDKALAQMKSNPAITADALAKARSFTEIFIQVTAVIGAPIAILVIALVVWIFSRIFDAKVTGHASMVISAYSAVPFVIENLSWSVQGLLLDPSKLTSRMSLAIGPARFVNAEGMSPLAAAAIAHVDVFSIWTAALLGIGIVTIANAPRSKAVVIGVAIWVLGLAPAALSALRAG